MQYGNVLAGQEHTSEGGTGAIVVKLDGKIAGIQYLRAFAALSVVWLHALGKIPGTVMFLGPSYFGGTGVDLFFVISGFIMATTTADRDISPWQFLSMRIIRIVPLYWFVTMSAIAMAPLGHEGLGIHLDAAVILKSLAFIPYNSPDFPWHLWPIIVPGWTLNYEMFFYLIFALSLALSRWRFAALIGALGTLVFIGAAVQPVGTSDLVVYTNPMLLEFAVGVVIALLVVRRNIMPLWLSIALLSIGIGFLSAHNSRFELTVGASLAVLGAIHPVISRYPIKLLMMLGDASYSIYLTHPFILAALIMLWSHWHGAPTLARSAAFMTGAIICSAVGGLMCFLYIEKPMTRRLRELVARRDVVSATGG